MSRRKKRKPDLDSLPIAEKFEVVAKAVRAGVTMAHGLCDGRRDEEVRLSIQQRVIYCHLSDTDDITESLAYDLAHTRSLPKTVRTTRYVNSTCSKSATIDGGHGMTFQAYLSYDLLVLMRVELYWTVDGEYDPYD